MSRERTIPIPAACWFHPTGDIDEPTDQEIRFNNFLLNCVMLGIWPRSLPDPNPLQVHAANELLLGSN